MRLFVADDDDQFRGLMQRVADRCGWQFSGCRNGGELIDTLAASGEDGIIFLDLVMPEVDGIEILGDLAHPAAGRPLYIVTGGPAVYSDMASLIARNRTVQIADTLVKPISIHEVMALLNSYSGRAGTGTG